MRAPGRIPATRRAGGAPLTRSGERPPGDGGSRLFERAVAVGYTAVVLDPGSAERHVAGLAAHVTRVVHVATAEELDDVLGRLVPQGDERRSWVVSSHDAGLLARAAAGGVATCLRMSAHDQDSLKAAIELGRAHRYLAMRFPDPTNIPLELVVASLQSSHTIVVKEITDPADAEDAVVSLGVMEVGSDGVLFSPRESEPLEHFLKALREAAAPRVEISVATVASTPIGMGHRACIDLA